MLITNPQSYEEYLWAMEQEEPERNYCPCGSEVDEGGKWCETCREYAREAMWCMESHYVDENPKISRYRNHDEYMDALCDAYNRIVDGCKGEGDVMIMELKENVTWLAETIGITPHEAFDLLGDAIEGDDWND